MVLSQGDARSLVSATGFKSILFAGQFIGHSRWRFEAFRSLGFECTYLDQRPHFDETSWRRPLEKAEFRLKHGPHVDRWNAAVIGAAKETKADVVWIDKGLFLREETVRHLHRWARVVVHCLHDDFRYRLYQRTPFERAVPEYDLHLVTRPANVDELTAFGARHVEKFLFSFEPSVHRPVAVTPAFGKDEPDVVFIGHYEPGREISIGAAAAAGVSVGIWGPMWRGRGERSVRRLAGKNGVVRGAGLWGDDYAGAFSGARIGLGLLSGWMRDQHTCRSMEIPACGGVLVAERTREHLELFEEGCEAVFFGSTSELTEAVARLAESETLRKTIATAGRERVVRSGYDHVSEAKRHVARIRSVMT
jgi:hypothetical protein